MTQDHEENKNNITYWKVKEVDLKATQTGWDEKVLVTQSCPTLCDHMNLSPPGSCVHGSLQVRITGVGSHSLLQGIFPTQGSNPGLLHCRRILYHLGHQGKPGVKATEKENLYTLVVVFCQRFSSPLKKLWFRANWSNCRSMNKIRMVPRLPKKMTTDCTFRFLSNIRYNSFIKHLYDVLTKEKFYLFSFGFTSTSRQQEY